jgi:hypothetical protein
MTPSAAPGRASRPALDRRLARRRTGAALIAVTVLGVVAATLSMAIVRQVFISSRANAYEQLASEARLLADGELDRMLLALNADPGAAFRRVLDGEQPRRCTLAPDDDPTLRAANPNHPVYVAGASWPAACGLSWGHAPSPFDGLATRLHGVATTGTPTGGVLRIEVLAAAGSAQVGRAATLVRDDAGRFRAYSVESLVMGPLSSSPSALTGTYYSVGQLSLPATSTPRSSAVQYASETQVSGARATTGLAVFHYEPATSANVTAGQSSDVRRITPAVGSETLLDAVVGDLAELACPDGAAVQSEDRLCLVPGGVYRTTNDQNVTLPANAAAVLLAPEVAGLRVRTRTEAADRAQVAPSADTYYNKASAAVSAGTHPGATSGWTELGLLPYPSTRMVATRQLQTHLGLCGPGFLTVGGSCTSTAGQGLLLVSGEPSERSDVFLAGPVTNAAVVASGDLVVPIWSHPRTGSATVAVPVFSAGRVGVVPVTRQSSANGARLTYAAPLVAYSLAVPAGFSATSMSAAPATVPALFPGPSQRLRAERRNDVSAQSLCGERICATW